MMPPYGTSEDNCFRYAPVLTLSDFWEAGKIAQALSEFGVHACAVGRDVIVAWDDLATADSAVIELRREGPDIDWSKVQINWAKRTSLSSDQ